MSLSVGTAARSGVRALILCEAHQVTVACPLVILFPLSPRYTVSSGVRLTHGVLGFVVVVQSSRHAPLHVDARVESFLEGFDTASHACA